MTIAKTTIEKTFRMTRALGAAAVVLALGAGCKGRPKAEGAAATEPDKTTGPMIAVLDISGGIAEQSPASVFAPQRKHSFDELLRVIERVAKDKDTRGVMVKFGSTSFGFARAEELGNALSELRKDKPVYCQGDAFTNATFFAAARSCSKIFVSPAGEVEAIGIAAQVVYMHKLLADELHLNIDFLQVGKFKGAEEPITRDGPSDEARASLEAVLVDTRAAWLEGIRTGRNPQAALAVEDGPYAAPKAKERGLVDEIGYFDDARDKVKKDTGAVRDEVRFGGNKDADAPEDLGDIVRQLAGEAGGGAPIALIRATGSIGMGGGGGLFGGSGGISEKELSKILRRAEKDDNIKAVVLRIDSPGGSALASDLLWHALMRIRAKKPIVVSIGDMAASGGYYLASTGNVIFADPTSIVGSIGVVGGKIGIGDALEKIGVHVVTFPADKGNEKAAHRAAASSPLVGWDEDTRARVFESMTAIYDLFLARVSEGRKIPVEKVAVSAEGRIFTGREGKARGLVDELGGLSMAIAKARELAKVANDAAVVVMESKPNLLDALGGQGGGGQGESAAASIPTPFSAAGPTIGDLLARAAPDLIPFAEGLAPLAEGERGVTALPYALKIR